MTLLFVTAVYFVLGRSIESSLRTINYVSFRWCLFLVRLQHDREHNSFKVVFLPQINYIKVVLNSQKSHYITVIKLLGYFLKIDHYMYVRHNGNIFAPEGWSMPFIFILPDALFRKRDIIIGDTIFRDTSLFIFWQCSVVYRFIAWFNVLKRINIHYYTRVWNDSGEYLQCCGLNLLKSLHVLRRSCKCPTGLSRSGYKFQLPVDHWDRQVVGGCRGMG